MGVSWTPWPTSGREVFHAWYWTFCYSVVLRRGSKTSNGMTSFYIHIYTRAHTHTVLLKKDKVSLSLFSNILRVIYPFFCILLTLPILVKMFWWIFLICSLISLRFYYPPLYGSLPFQNSFSLSWLLYDFTLYSNIYLKTENWDSQVRAAPLSFWVRIYLSQYNIF